VPALKAKVVDTTGAGDCFVGALAARMMAGATPVEAARYASAAASCSVERLGAAPSMPTAREVAARLARA
jgi:ribokinase